MSTCKFCGVVIVWRRVEDADVIPLPEAATLPPPPSGWVPCYGCECGVLHDHRPVCTGVPMSVEAADNARRYAWARCYEAERECVRLRGELEASASPGGFYWCIECDERAAVVEGLCDPCLKRHYHKEFA